MRNIIFSCPGERGKGEKNFEEKKSNIPPAPPVFYTSPWLYLNDFPGSLDVLLHGVLGADAEPDDKLVAHVGRNHVKPT